jgi:iron complex transport system substrate-binding protein
MHGLDIMSPSTRELRIVSLLPSITEVLSALGVDHQIVGITHECDYPERALEGATVVTVSDISPHKMTQEEIHQQVTGSLMQGHSLYGLNGDVLRSLKPDIIFTQSLCDVCAVSYPVVTSTCAKIFGGENESNGSSSPKIVSLEPNNLKDVLDTFLVAGRALDLPPARSQQLVDKLQTDLDFIRRTVNEHLARQRSSPQKRPLVAFLEWHDPFFSGGHWIPDLMDIAGCDYTMCKSGDRSAAVTDDDLQTMDPDFILIGPCGFSVERAFEDTKRLLKGDGNKRRTWWKSMRAVKNDNVFALDGNSFYARPGPRLVQGCGLIARCVHGEQVGGILGEDLAPSFGMRRVTVETYED